MKIKFRVLILGLLLTNVSPWVKANDIDVFIQRIDVKTYDCPDDEFIPQVDNYLKLGSPSWSQLVRLNLYKAQWLICVGKNDTAQTILSNILQDKSVDKEARIYASVHYQLGFIHDVNDDPKRCDYYRQSEQLAKNKFDDIYLSSQLGLITVCDQEKQDLGTKLGRLFALLQTFSLKDDQAALAHIHNNIGLLYGSMGQSALAAEQYEKSYELGKKVYEEKNQLAPLISVISAYTGARDYEKASQVIEELHRGNLRVNTPLTNNWYHFAQSRHFYQTEDYAAMRQSMRTWEVFLQQISNKQMDSLYAWYKAALCLHEGDKTCVSAFLQQDNVTTGRLAKNASYLEFLVEAYLFLDNIPAAQRCFDRYASVLSKKIAEQQSSARVLGIANLHSKILSLESDLQQAEKKRVQVVVLVLAIILSLSLLAYFAVGRRYLQKLTIDPLTGLRNEQAALSLIRRVKSPVHGKVNAVAVFDVNNFTEINSQFGYMEGETALRHVADSLKLVTRERDIVGRMGANQFIVCLKNLDESSAVDLFERIQKALTNIAFPVGGSEQVNIDSSMHIYSSVGSFSDLSDVLNEIRGILSKKNVDIHKMNSDEQHAD